MENENVLSETPFFVPENVNWELLATSWESSGLTRQAFCEQHQINYRHFVYQRNKFNAKRKPKASPWLAVKQAQPKSPVIPVTTSATLPPSFLLRSSQGHQWSIPLDADTPTLKVLLAFIREN